MVDIPTPALLIDLDVFERNLATMRDACRARGRLYRPHGKAHKSPIIAKEQLEYGAHGQCAAKLGEAEVLVHGGIKEVLITAPVVGRRKIERLLALAEIAPDIKVVVDSPQNINELSTAAVAKGRKLKVLIDVNVGQNRTGVDSAEMPSFWRARSGRRKGSSSRVFKPMAARQHWTPRWTVFRWAFPAGGLAPCKSFRALK